MNEKQKFNTYRVTRKEVDNRFISYIRMKPLPRRRCNGGLRRLIRYHIYRVELPEGLIVWIV